MHDAYFTPKPVQRPRPTIIVGGSATAQRLPRLAARFADEYVITNPSPEQVRAVREMLDRNCERIRRDPAELRLSVFIAIAVAPTDADVQRLYATYQTTNPQYVRMMDGRANWIQGTPDEAHAAMARLSEAGVARALLSVNCDLHRDMLPLLASSAS